MKIVICNMGYTGYWVACWRELVRRAGIEVKIFTPKTKYPYGNDILTGLPIRVFTDEEFLNAPCVRAAVASENPDVLIVGGWASKSFVSLAYDNQFAAVKKLLAIDSSWDGSLRQLLCRFRLHKLVERFDGVIVGGDRGRKFARWIGFPNCRIYTSIYGYDAKAFEVMRETWPRRFCFVGRYAAVKGLPCLLAAYRKYTSSRRDQSWPLDCYGDGPLKARLSGVPGVVDHGFIQPDKLPESLASEGVFVFPSLREPWGVALAEACGSGLPVIVSDKVSSADDLVENGVNGYVVKPNHVDDLAVALDMMHNRYEVLRQMGDVSKQKAAQFSPAVWADRWMEAINDICR